MKITEEYSRLITKLLLTVLFIGIANSEVNAQSTWAELGRLEKSTDYSENVVQLEFMLRNGNLPDSAAFKAKAMLVDNYNNLTFYDKAISLCHEGIMESQKKSDTYYEASFNILLARTYYHLNQIDQFILYNTACLEIAEKHNHYDLLKRSYHNKGVIDFEVKRDLISAERNFTKAIAYNRYIVQTKNNNVARNLRMLATTYDAQGKLTKADSIYKITYDVYASFNDTLGLSEVLTFRARLFLSMKKYENALALSEEAITLAEKVSDVLYLQTALSMKEQISAEMGNYEVAYQTKNRIHSIILNNNTSLLKDAIADSEAKFQVAELRNKEQLLALSIQQERKNYIYISITILILTIAILVIVYQRKISNEKQQLKLANARQVFEAEEKERLRIAKDLHDNMGAYTTSIISQIDMMDFMREGFNPEKLKNLRDDAENIMTILRETIWVLRHKSVSVDGFYDLVKLYANKQLAELLHIRVSYAGNSTENTKYLNSITSINLYRIIQEVVQNIIKHSKANHVEFNISVHEKVMISVLDNGVGFDTEKCLRISGIDNMRQRAAEINYILSIESKPGAGCLIRILEK